ncbi:LPXTG cell wall anchor domain-containing protein [Aeromicrobium sp. UC242_57]|uniref:LPXTG cell wall anchor domain-containing protein n=1 Tax=Aeromicrobium sp. UC242_57 TaxID=3374624 RepID=UPI0037883DB1
MTTPSDNDSDSDEQGALPDTGMSCTVLPLAAGGVLILLLGAGLVWWSRRRGALPQN